MSLPPSVPFTAFESQAKRLRERRGAKVAMTVRVCGVDFEVMPGVYATSVDTELMADSVRLESDEDFLEIGCGSGAVSLLLARRCRGGMATDINPQAILNSRLNSERLGVSTVQFVLGHVYAGIERSFDAIVCNPPYNNRPAQDEIDRMFWDPDDVLKREVFAGARQRLRDGGRLYLGWADFSDLDHALPLDLAKRYGFVLNGEFERPSHSGRCRFEVFEFLATSLCI